MFNYDHDSTAPDNNYVVFWNSFNVTKTSRFFTIIDSLSKHLISPIEFLFALTNQTESQSIHEDGPLEVESLVKVVYGQQKLAK